jgi:diguanylate cyclase (GGDEF)-like protein
VASHASCIVSGNGELYLYGGLVDITERKRTETEIQFLAYYDSLTQLPNRRLFRDRLDNSLSLARRKNHYGAVIFVDVDNFKDVNDAWGHTAGDELIQELAFRLRHSLRQSDTVARFGGDEFIIFLPELADDESEAARLSLYVAEKLRGIFANPFLVNDYEAMITASIGITLFPKGTEETIDDLIREADMAMYQAKEAGRNVVCLFEGIRN